MRLMSPLVTVSWITYHNHSSKIGQFSDSYLQFYRGDGISSPLHPTASRLDAAAMSQGSVIYFGTLRWELASENA
jgi:hypothetical protein